MPPPTRRVEWILSRSHPFPFYMNFCTTYGYCVHDNKFKNEPRIIHVFFMIKCDTIPGIFGKPAVWYFTSSYILPYVPHIILFMYTFFYYYRQIRVLN